MYMAVRTAGSALADRRLAQYASLASIEVPLPITPFGPANRRGGHVIVAEVTGLAPPDTVNSALPSLHPQERGTTSFRTCLWSG